MKKYLFALFFIFINFIICANQYVNNSTTSKKIVFESDTYNFSAGDNLNDGLTLENAVKDIATAIANCNEVDTVYLAGDDNTWDTFCTSDIPNEITVIGVYEKSKPIVNRQGGANLLKINGTTKRVFKNISFYNRFSSHAIYGEVDGSNVWFYNCDFDSLTFLSNTNFAYPASGGFIKFYDCLVKNAKGMSQFNRQGNIYYSNCVINNNQMNNAFAYSTTICSNSIITNNSAVDASNLNAASSRNAYAGNTNIGTFGSISLNTQPVYVYDFFIPDTSFCKNSGIESSHIGLSQSNMNLRITYNDFSNTNISAVLGYGTFTNDTITSILKNYSIDTQYQILKNSNLSDTKVYQILFENNFPDSASVIGRFAYASQTTDTPQITQKLNGFIYNAGNNVIIKVPAYKGFNAVRLAVVKESNPGVYIINQVYDNHYGGELDITSEITESGLYFYALRPEIKN